jgi:hypothetical protein
MMDFYGSLCADFIPEMRGCSANGWDPMMEEMETWCDRDSRVMKPLSFSPSPTRSGETPQSPEHMPQSALWGKIANLNAEATVLGISNVIHFGPGVHLTKEVGGQVVTAGITEQVAQISGGSRNGSRGGLSNTRLKIVTSCTLIMHLALRRLCNIIAVCASSFLRNCCLRKKKERKKKRRETVVCTS